MLTNYLRNIKYLQIRCEIKLPMQYICIIKYIRIKKKSILEDQRIFVKRE